MTVHTQEKKIKILEQIAVSAGAYYSFNLTKNLIPGCVYQWADGQHVNVNRLASLPDDAKWTDYMAFWGNRLSGSAREEYFAFFDRQRLLACFRNGETHVQYAYWTETATLRPMPVEQHLVLYNDEESGDVLGIAYIIDLTERERARAKHRTLEKQLKKSEVERDTERRYMEVLTRDFLVVYHVNLLKNASTLIKADPNVANYDSVKASLRQTNQYRERMEIYCANYVIPDLRVEFGRVMEAGSLLERLRHTPRFVYRYRTMPHKQDQQYFEVQALRLQSTMDSGEILIAFRCIDDVVTAQQRRQIELEEQIEQERNQIELLQALGRNYYSIFRIDLEDDSYTEISCREEGRGFFDSAEPSAQKTLDGLCQRIIAPRYLERMRSFFDLSTLADRLADTDYVEAECVTSNGQWHRAKFFAKRRNEAGRATHVLYVTQVIDNEKQYEEHLIAKAEYADYANRAKTEFISQVAHDIRTPMNSIFGFLEIAEASLDQPDRLRYSLEKIRTAGEFLKALADDVLDISRMEHGRLQLHPAELSMTKLLDDFAVSMQHAKSSKQQRLHFDFHDIIHDRVLLDPLRLKQIYSNVLSNAIKYTPDGGDIRFEVCQQELPGEERVRIMAQVTDTGVGMSEEFMQKMFAKFERETDTRINQVSGYGLGLTIVKQLVDMMGGSIDVRSRRGEGTEFRIVLDAPYAPEHAPEVAAAEAVDLTCCAGMRLLVAEDNELNREVVTELLAMQGIHCDCVEDGALCLERFRSQPQRYDAILMDMQMPNMDGVEATQLIRALPIARATEIPIIAMTANALGDDVRKCLSAGMDIHLSKPMDMARLISALHALVKSR